MCVHKYLDINTIVILFLFVLVIS